MPVRPRLLLLIPVAAAAQNASFKGVTVNTTDGQPLAGVHVQLLPAPSDGSGEIYGAMSNRAGQFSMANLPPGAYFMRCDRNGFVLAHSGGARKASGSVALKPGENITDFKIEMAPQAVIAGRVLDQYGDPMQYVRVQISPAAQTDGSFAEGGATAAATNDRGEFRLAAKAWSTGHLMLPPQVAIRRLPRQAKLRGNSSGRNSRSFNGRQLNALARRY